MHSSRPEISVVVTTRDRADRLAALLESLRGQTIGSDRFEVLVVDDGSTDNTQAILTAERDHGVLAVRTIEHTPGSGPGAARNSAVVHARAPLVTFIDDDCEADRGWLAGFLAEWSGDEMCFLQGATTPIESEISEIGPLSYTYDIRELDVNFPTCNIAYPKALFERIGGFDAKTFSRASGEDVDLAWRAIAAGAHFAFVPEAQARHAVVHVGRAGMLRRAWKWGDAVPAFARNPQLRRGRLIYRVFFNWSHWWLLRLLVALALPRRRALWPLKYWLAERYVANRRWAPGHHRPSMGALSWNLAIDVVEFSAMVRGSLRHRTLVL